jgi:hypothetical protein
MGLEIRVEGAARLHALAAQMREAGRKDLAREMGTALGKATEPIQKAIESSAAETMPRSGGYNATFTKSLKFKSRRRSAGSEAGLSLTTYADGKGDRRDINALEAGNLRHPIWGRSRPGARKGQRHANPWAVTRIRSGFWQRGTDQAMEETERQLEAVVDQYEEMMGFE